jgi:hypothetical protein
VFLELECADGSVRRLDELAAGDEGSVVLTHGGGLVRYRLHDRVRVEGVWNGTPCLRFLGRDNQVSDLVGEKLNEVFVRGALARALGGGERCAFLVPQATTGGGRYVCVTDDPAAATPEAAHAIESALRDALHYRQARLLGQLEPVGVVYRADARARYERYHLARGLKWGAIKHTALVVSAAEQEVRELAG